MASRNGRVRLGGGPRSRCDRGAVVRTRHRRYHGGSAWSAARSLTGSSTSDRRPRPLLGGGRRRGSGRWAAGAAGRTAATRPAARPGRTGCGSAGCSPRRPPRRRTTVATNRSQTSAHGWRPRPGTRCSSRGAPLPSARWTCAHANPCGRAWRARRCRRPRCARGRACSARGRPRWGRSRAVGHGPDPGPGDREHVLHRERDAGVLARARDLVGELGRRSGAASGTAGAAPRCGAPRVAAAATERRIRPIGSAPHTRWVTARQGACTASTGTPDRSAKPADRGDVLADRVGPHHQLDAVVAELGGQLERGTRAGSG